MFLANTEEEKEAINAKTYYLTKKNIIKVENKPSNPKNKNPLANRYPYNNKKNF
jgi:hypothetical protein